MLRSGLSDASTLYAPVALDPLAKRVPGSSTNTALLHFLPVYLTVHTTTVFFLLTDSEASSQRKQNSAES